MTRLLANFGGVLMIAGGAGILISQFPPNSLLLTVGGVACFTLGAAVLTLASGVHSDKWPFILIVVAVLFGLILLGFGLLMIPNQLTLVVIGALLITAAAVFFVWGARRPNGSSGDPKGPPR